MNPAPIIQARGVGKRFPGVVALDDVSLDVGAGEVIAIIGENGAGKPTLMKILAGVQPPSSGELWIDGTARALSGVAEALGEGIALIHQELNLATNLSAAANIFLGREPKKFGGMIDRAKIREDAVKFLAEVGLEISPDTVVGELPIGRQQLIEIAKALSTDARVLIMDEPTSSLSQSETENLFGVIHALRKRGVSVLYISHRLGEVIELADRVVVLRDGNNVGGLQGEEITRDAMVTAMVGRELDQFYPHEPRPAGEVALQVSGLRTAFYPQREVGFSIRAGEIVGLAGLVGAGRSEMLRALFGIDPMLAGRVEVKGKALSLGSPRDAISAGVALVPEDRKSEGLLVEMSVRENISLAALREDGHFRDARREADLSAEMIERFGIKTPNDAQIIRFLSGGNQQKVALGKWLALKPAVLLLDEPTRGVDVGAKAEIYKIMDELAASGVAILFASSELEEVIGMSDRALVMHEGEITGELNKEALSEEAIISLATGSGTAEVVISA